MSKRTTVKVCAENGSYDIVIGKGVLQDFQPAGGYAVVTDENVYALYGHCFDRERMIVLPAGEESKSIGYFSVILNRLMEMGLSRQDTLVALGGGVVGDIAGFAAATFKRGMRFVQAPTTLLAQVDSSVGGKVAVNLEKGKNMAGVFYQPEAVYADIGTLKTLDARQYAAGMAEVIKYAYIADGHLYEKLCRESYDIEEIVGDCCTIKARYVHEDPYDRGVRMQLNYGHTVGHAIETAAGYGTYLHGEAVAIGMVCAAAVGEALGISPSGLTQGTIGLLRQHRLPVETSPEILKQALCILDSDKKANGRTICFILIDRIGHAVMEKLPIGDVAKAVEDAIL